VEGWFTVLGESVHHFLLVEVDGNVVTVEAVRDGWTVTERV
jgi:hypothetical protein